jgi:hypothetical protein
MNCDSMLDGKLIATVERLGVVLAVVKDRRGLIDPGPAKHPARTGPQSRAQ